MFHTARKTLVMCAKSVEGERTIHNAQCIIHNVCFALYNYFNYELFKPCFHPKQIDAQLYMVEVEHIEHKSAFGDL
jgi:hypothetical protein